LPVVAIATRSWSVYLSADCQPIKTWISFLNEHCLRKSSVFIKRFFSTSQEKKSWFRLGRGDYHNFDIGVSVPRGFLLVLSIQAHWWMISFISICLSCCAWLHSIYLLRRFRSVRRMGYWFLFQNKEGHRRRCSLPFRHRWSRGSWMQ